MIRPEVMDSIIVCAVWIFVYMTAVCVIALIGRRNDLADIAWGIGFILVSMLTLFRNPDPHIRGYVVTGMVWIWGARLSIHIYFRNRGKPEDFRYRKWREEWGRWLVPRSFLQVFLLQGFLLLLISLPLIWINTIGGSEWNLLDFAGCFVWGVGFLFEAVGDEQLRRFSRDPSNRGRILSTGLWKYTRHPNYFGEVVLWWGIFLMALSVPQGWITVVSPLTITWLILKVSGIPMLERKYEGSAEFEAYRRRTNAFFPWPPGR